MPASRVREMLDGCKLKNELRPGFWNYADDSGAGFRLVNQTSECSGRPLVLVTDSLAYPPDPALGLGPAPADIVEAEGLVTLVVSKGTLVPQGHLSRGVLARTKSCNAAGKRALTVNPDDLKAIKKPQSHLGMSAGAAHASLAPGQMVYGPPRQMPMAMATGMSLVGMPVATAYPVTTLQPRAMQPSAPCASAQQPHSAFSESTQSIAIARWQQATSLHSGNAVGAPNPGRGRRRGRGDDQCYPVRPELPLAGRRLVCAVVLVRCLNLLHAARGRDAPPRPRHHLRVGTLPASLPSLRHSGGRRPRGPRLRTAATLLTPLPEPTRTLRGCFSRRRPRRTTIGSAAGRTRTRFLGWERRTPGLRRSATCPLTKPRLHSPPPPSLSELPPLSRPGPSCTRATSARRAEP